MFKSSLALEPLSPQIILTFPRLNSVNDPVWLTHGSANHLLIVLSKLLDIFASSPSVVHARERLVQESISWLPPAYFLLPSPYYSLGEALCWHPILTLPNLPYGSTSPLLLGATFPPHPALPLGGHLGAKLCEGRGVEVSWLRGEGSR
jgi:hypothetical protein